MKKLGGTPNLPLTDVRVLVVEDEYLLADDLARELRRAGAIPVGPFGSVTAAEAGLRDQPFDAAILDVNLHGSIATEFISRVAAAGVPCLIVSGYGEEALPESIRHFPNIEKPVDYRLVVSKLAEYLACVRKAQSGEDGSGPRRLH